MRVESLFFSSFFPTGLEDIIIFLEWFTSCHQQRCLAIGPLIKRVIRSSSSKFFCRAITLSGSHLLHLHTI